MSSSKRKAINKALAKQAAQRSSNQTITHIQQQASFQGPLPPPAMLQHYDQIIPGAAARIISMWEMQASHRQELEKQVVASAIQDSKRGLILGFIVSLVAILAGTFCIMNGHAVEGSVLGGSAVPALVGVFVYGSWQRRKEREAQLRGQNN